MGASWKQQARSELIELRGGSGAWSYYRKHAPGVEPTVLSCLGLLASGENALDSDIIIGQIAAEWLVKIQQSDGSLAVAEGVATPGWPTPYALILWSALAGFQISRLRARNWLLDEKAMTLPKGHRADNVIGHDPSLLGWPWVPGTHSWLEPTGLAIVALCREGLNRHCRVDSAVKLILDRALEHGGWNCGTKFVFGTEQRPQLAPTGVALLALAARGEHSAAAARAVAYLSTALRGVRAAVSVGWGVLGLRACNALPVEAEDWLREAHAHCSGKPDAAMGLALLLLAASERAPSLLMTPCRAAP